MRNPVFKKDFKETLFPITWEASRVSGGGTEEGEIFIVSRVS